jgi:hypothetical protein
MILTHVSSAVDLHKRKVATGLDLSKLFTTVKLQVLDRSFVEVLLTWPFKSFGPGLVTKPVA